MLLQVVEINNADILYSLKQRENKLKYNYEVVIHVLTNILIKCFPYLDRIKSPSHHYRHLIWDQDNLKRPIDLKPYFEEYRPQVACEGSQQYDACNQKEDVLLSSFFWHYLFN